MSKPCPNCGYCPTCGRAQITFPYRPLYPTYPVYPWYGNGITYGGTAYNLADNTINNGLETISGNVQVS